MSQTTYIKDILKKFKMYNSNPASTPLSAGTKLTKNAVDHPDNTIFPYRKLVGALMYVARATRPDIEHAISVLAQFSSNPKHEH